MAIFVKFFDKKLNDEIDVALGDRSIIQLDGRSSKYTQNSIAKKECLKRGYIAYKIWNVQSIRDINYDDKSNMILV